MLIERMKGAAAKSSPKVSLFKHCYGVLQIVDHMVHHTPHYPVEKASVLRLGAFLHDIGKLHPDFQDMLHPSHDTQVKRIKHEAQTYDFYRDVINDIHYVARWIAYEMDCRMEVPNDLADMFAFAVTHHGLFYSSYEDGAWWARREWIQMRPQEERRITLADLLIRYYPLGGAVIFADMLHSEQLATGRDNTAEIKKMKHPQDWKEYIVLRQKELLLVKEEDHGVRMPLDLLALLIS
jgi:hypothetical protein